MSKSIKNKEYAKMTPVCPKIRLKKPLVGQLPLAFDDKIAIVPNAIPPRKRRKKKVD